MNHPIRDALSMFMACISGKSLGMAYIGFTTLRGLSTIEGSVLAGGRWHNEMTVTVHQGGFDNQQSVKYLDSWVDMETLPGGWLHKHILQFHQGPYSPHVRCTQWRCIDFLFSKPAVLHSSAGRAMLHSLRKLKCSFFHSVLCLSIYSGGPYVWSFYMTLYVHICPSIVWDESGMSDPKLSELFLDCRPQSFRDDCHHIDPFLLILQEFALDVFWLIIVDLFLLLTWMLDNFGICWLCLGLCKPLGMCQNHHPKNRWSNYLYI